MAKEILAVSTHPSNPVSQLAELIQAALEERSNHSEYFSTDYKQQLHTFVGLGFTAVMRKAANKVFSTYACILYYSTSRQEKFKQLSSNCRMICNAMHPFKVLGYPRYYDDFLLAATHTVDPSDAASAETKNERQEKLLELLSKCR